MITGPSNKHCWRDANTVRRDQRLDAGERNPHPSLIAATYVERVDAGEVNESRIRDDMTVTHVQRLDAGEMSEP